MNSETFSECIKEFEAAAGNPHNAITMCGDCQKVMALARWHIICAYYSGTNRVLKVARSMITDQGADVTFKNS